MRQLNCLLIGFFIFSLFGFSYDYMNNPDKSQYNHSKPQGEILKIYIPLFKFTPNQSIENKNSNSGYDKAWYSKVTETIQKEEYNISYSEEYRAYQSPNRNNNYRFIYFNEGFTVKPRTTKTPLFDVNDKSISEEEKKYETLGDWGINFSLSGYGRGNKNKKFTGTDINVSKNAAFIEDNNLKITYLNDEKGMRQDFIIKERPEGKGNIIDLDFKIDTKLKTQITENEILFINEANETVLHYNSLNVTDANGKLLLSYFKRISNKRYSIIVEDENAVYPVTIDPLSSTPNWTEESNQISASFGYSVSTAGDVNGDGYSDIIVGAAYYDNGESNEGRVFIYYGSSSGLSHIAIWTAEGNQVNARFGDVVSTAGDIDGDGYSDIIIGSKDYDNGQVNEGRVFAYYGSSTGLSTTADWTAESNQDSAYFGYSISTAGDVNGDGYSDIIIGAIWYENGQTHEGRAHVYYGAKTGISTTTNWTAEGNQNEALFGCSVSTTGDVNGDRYSDVIVGAYMYDNGEADEGRAFVYHGSSLGLSAAADWTAESNQAGANLGYSVSTAGDVNGDGYSDVITGVRMYDNGQSNEGRAYVYHGSSLGLSTTVNWTAESNQINAYFGSHVSTAGDINGDGYCDIVIGAWAYDNGEVNEGMTYVYHGTAAGLPASANWTVDGNQSGAYYGFSVSTAGDVNGDGYSDVIIGAPNYTNGEGAEGRAYVYHGSPAGLSPNALWTANSGQTSAWLGKQVSSAGDVNGDGYSDVIVGAYLYDNGQTDEGRVFVFHGSATGLSTVANWTAEGNQDSTHFGHAAATAGDVNGDGYSDVIVGAYTYDNGEKDEGIVVVYYGSSTGLSAAPNWTAEGNQLAANFGYSVSTAGDVNGDGYSDVIIGANSYDNGQTNEGRAFVYHGSASGLSLTPDWFAESNQSLSYFGHSVSTAGDVNGDGYSDVIVGAQYYDNGQNTEGKAFVFHGSSSGLSATENWTAEGNLDDAWFGNSVSTAGDVNGDGYSDVIIGAPYYDNGQTNEGMAFVFHGSAYGLSATANWTGESNQEYAQYGYSVSTAGDVNGDGYSDVISGAWVYTNEISTEGRVFVYHGSPTGLSSTADWIAESNQSYTEYGLSVSSAGDVNGDGYSDVIVGAPFYDVSLPNEGRAFVYYGNEGTGLRSTIQQYKPVSTNIIGPQGLSGTSGQVRLNIFGKSPFGRADGRIVYEVKQENQPFSGSPITNSTSYTGAGSYTDLGTTITGKQINRDISGLALNHEYKWRVRIQFNQENNPYQKFGPWKYYANYSPKPFGGFKTNSMAAQSLALNLKAYLEGFWNGTTMISDTVSVFLAKSTSPYTLMDSQKVVFSNSGTASITFTKSATGSYYLVIKHRNHLETWSRLPQTFTAGSPLSYDFTTAQTQAYGNNLILSNGAYCIYGGDINQDGFVDGADMAILDNDLYNYVSGYVTADVNGDQFVDGADMAILDNNLYNYVGVMKPGGKDIIKGDKGTRKQGDKETKKQGNRENMNKLIKK